MPAGAVVTAVATGHNFDLAVTSTGQVYAWGFNQFGQLGQGNTTNTDVPVLVPLPAGTDIASVSAGHDTSYALTSTGQVYAWGYNRIGELGIGNNTGPEMCSAQACSTSPVPVSLPAGTLVTAIAAGADHVLARTSTGTVLAWGENTDGQLGVGNNTGPDNCSGLVCSWSPVAISAPAGVNFASVAAGHFFSLAVTSGGGVYSWGTNFTGQLGIGNTTQQNTPAPVTLPAGTDVTAVAGGDSHTLALTATGQVFSWGSNGEGQLGNGTNTAPDNCGGDPCSTTPQAVSLPGGATAKAIAAGNRFSLVIVGTPPGLGYWLGASDGGIFSYGNAPFFGSLGNLVLNKPVVGMAATPGGQGYWLVASDGGVFSEGNARFFGSTGGIVLNKPVVGMAASPDGRGYWLVASDGGIFSYGDALFHGSRGGQPLNKPIVGMAATPTGEGYWLVASDGGIFSYGDAVFHGSRGGQPLNKPIVGMAATPTGEGYWFVASDGGIFSYGDAVFFGSTGGMVLNKPVVGMAASPDGRGYWLVASDGGIFNYGDAGFFGSAGGIVLNKPIVGMATP
jgi:hypothetical protein